MSHTFRVWAPAATRVAVEVGGERLAMEAAPGGWWVHEHGQAGPGDDYAFVLDGGDPLPDPRSRRQPQGVHGPSRLVAPWTGWTDAAWTGAPLADAVLYEVHVGTFSAEGTLDAVIPHLDEVVDLGVTAIELMPLASFPGRHGWGYDGVDLWSVHEGYGGPDALDRLVDACHARGLAVVLDVVYNHLGPDGNHLGAFGPYFTDRYSTPWGPAVNLDGRGSDEVRAFVVDNALMWLRDHHLDGLRLDAVHAIIDTSAVHILEELATAVRGLESELGRRLWVIAESDLNDPRVVRDVAAGGHGCDAQWSDDLHHALWSALSGERDGYYADFGRLEDVATALRDAYVYAGRHSRFRGRRHGRPAGGLPGSRFLGYLQNHDQVGNRARGERSAMLLTPDRLAAGAALVFTAPFVPMLFAGEEWGARTPFLYFTDHQDQALADAVRRGRREEFAAFGWAPESVPDPQDPLTFAASRLDRGEREREPHAGLLRWHRELIRLRREQPCLRDGRRDLVEVCVDEVAQTVVVRRQAVTVACNLSAVERTVGVPGASGPARLRWPREGRQAPVADGAVRLPAGGVAIWAPSC